MDPLKKIVADRLKTQVAGPHPDAEVLSAFAENALPTSERETVLQHLSTCSDCRDIIFLAAPFAAESQPVVSAAKARRFFALRWGTLTACVVIATVFLVSRHQAPQNEQLAKSVPRATGPAAPAATDTIIAAEKAPTELREFRDRMPAKVAAPTATTGHAEPKHITAKPEGNMSFADSGEVSVNAPTAENARVEPRTMQNLQTNGRSVADLKQISPGAAQAASAPTASVGTGSGVSGGSVQGLTVGTGTSARPYGAYGADVSTKNDTALHGYVGGTVFDASGAVIPNVKVTALGPLGTKTATSDQSGKYALDQLAAGNYEFKFTAPGFTATELRQVAVMADKPANLDVKLSPGAATETVAVEAAAPQIVQQAQQTGLQSNEQQQNANEIQAQEVTVEAAAVKVPQAGKHKGARSSTQPVPALAKALALPAWQWSLSPQGTVQRSSDIGKTWQPVAVNANVIFRAISSLGPEVWTGGNGGALFHSTDSGLHWTQVLPIAAGVKLQSDITQIQFTDPQHLIVITSDSQVWTTADGGQTWFRK